MALYVKLTAAEIAAFAARYNLDVIDFSGIEQGVQNTNYFLATTTGRFILTVCEEEISVSDLPFFNNAMLYAAQHGVPCPVPLKNVNGEFTSQLKNKPAGIVSFLDGHMAEDIQKPHLESLGRFLARMHTQTKNFDMRRANPVGFDGVEELINKNEKVDTLAPGLKATVLQELAAARGELAAYNDLPGGFIHADIFPDNVFFNGANVTGIIDFYFSCTDFYAYDLAVAINAWCFDDNGFTYNEGKIKTLIAAYQSVRPLSAAEKAAFGALLRRAALRFFATRAWDKFYPKKDAVVGVKDPMEYIAKLRAFKENKLDITL